MRRQKTQKTKEEIVIEKTNDSWINRQVIPLTDEQVERIESGEIEEVITGQALYTVQPDGRFLNKKTDTSFTLVGHYLVQSVSGT